MAYMDCSAEMRASGVAPMATPWGATSPRPREGAVAIAHVVDGDDDVQQLLARWLAAVGIESRTYTRVTEFLGDPGADCAGCLVVDAQPLPLGGLAQVMRHATHFPIVMTAYQADVAMAVRAMKTGAVDFVEKPLHEREIVAAVCGAIEVNRQHRLVVSRHADLRARFATLSRRERQVMALVTAGKLNKQVGGDLGLSEITVKAHRGAAVRKMGARTLAELVRMADALGEDIVSARSTC